MPETKTTKGDSAAPVIEFQPRDFELLRGLFESRLMTQEQATRLYFDGKTEAAKKRLQKLKALRLIAERERRVYHPAILYLTKRGFDCLAAHGKLGGYPRMAWHQLEKRAQVSELTL
ncbi:MAG: replication-relaxation family protein, partial [Rhodoferax sp.]|nr:replication-relaxation family protein [Rhodoferax sp.]